MRGRVNNNVSKYSYRVGQLWSKFVYFFDREWYPIWYNFHKNVMHYFMFLSCLSLYNIVKMPCRIQSICLFGFFFFIYLIFFIGYRWPDSIGRCPVQNRRNLIFWNGQCLHREVNLFLLACVNSDAWHFISILGVLLTHLIII